MKEIDIARSLRFVMKGNLSMKISRIEKYSMISHKKYKTETINQANDYGKLERNT